eukprot:CAMPEP_0197418034 /NCGR_PEP_ID=MMETSP1170-20131217/3904_1 /TAXON_ID=54406 /ORGANISM="Sarcinochrysis sp, Strain CCMP770" /LENGTH=112 /DNA_ID=CAMNT_0042945047 /DNA_START=72 /DNA_END=410 /DNA_ORIENTATION=-
MTPAGDSPRDEARPLATRCEAENSSPKRKRGGDLIKCVLDGCASDHEGVRTALDGTTAYSTPLRRPVARPTAPCRRRQRLCLVGVPKMPRLDLVGGFVPLSIAPRGSIIDDL